MWRGEAGGPAKQWDWVLQEEGRQGKGELEPHPAGGVFSARREGAHMRVSTVSALFSHRAKLNHNQKAGLGFQTHLNDCSPCD